MNVLTTLPDGSTYCLTEHDAAVLQGYLMDCREHAPEPHHSVITGMLDNLRLRMTPEAQFDADLYMPEHYVPGWVADV